MRGLATSVLRGALATPVTIVGQVLWASPITAALLIGGVIALAISAIEGRQRVSRGVAIAVLWFVVASGGQLLLDHWFTAGPIAANSSFEDRAGPWASLMLGVSAGAALLADVLTTRWPLRSPGARSESGADH